MYSTAVDPLKTRILFEETPLPGIESLQTDAHLQGGFINETITKPAMIVESEDNNIRYYLRAIAWDKTLLLKVEKNGTDWVVKEVQEDNATARMSAIIGKGKLIYECT